MKRVCDRGPYRYRACLLQVATLVTHVPLPDSPYCPLLSQCVLFGRSMLEHPVPSSLTVWAEPVFYLGYFPTVTPVLWGFLHSCPPLVTLPTAEGFTFVFAVSLSCCPSVRVIPPHLTHPSPHPRALPYSSSSHQPDLQTEAESQTWDLQARAKALVSLFCDLCLVADKGCAFVSPSDTDIQMQT